MNVTCRVDCVVSENKTCSDESCFLKPSSPTKLIESLTIAHSQIVNVNLLCVFALFVNIYI